MKSILVTAVILLSLLFGREQADASGAITILMKVPQGSFEIVPAHLDPTFKTSKIYQDLEFSNQDIYVARMDQSVRRKFALLVSLGYETILGLEEFGQVSFHYSPTFKAYLGALPDENILVLLEGNAEAEED